MRPVKQILSKFNGLHYSREYLCFAEGSLSQPLFAYIVNGNQVFKDITNRHLFTGYCPLVFVFSESDLPVAHDEIELAFSHTFLLPNEKIPAKDVLAMMRLVKNQEKTAGDERIVYYEGIAGSHRFLTPFQQWAGGLINNWYNKRPGNVFLHNELYRQVQIAYSVPRVISLITVKVDDRVNLFPTDLHGRINASHYLVSLRSGGKACEQVKHSRRILISRMGAEKAGLVYSLGKNHMREPKAMVDLPFEKQLSSAVNWPVPEGALSSLELELVESTVHGIHEIFLFRILGETQFAQGSGQLVHIHNAYASWRFKKGLEGNYLIF